MASHLRLPVVMGGGDLYLLKEILGHKSIAMTQRYAHLSPEFKKSAVNLLDKIFAHAPQPEATGSTPTPAPVPVTPASPTPADCVLVIANTFSDAGSGALAVAPAADSRGVAVVIS